jgi:hypothetical protein
MGSDYWSSTVRLVRVEAEAGHELGRGDAA